MPQLPSFEDIILDAVSRQLPPPIPAGLMVHADDDSDAEPDAGHRMAPGETAQAEGQSFIIHYRNAAGRESLRRVTIWGIRATGEGVPMLVGRCHERQATRSFRVDRILSATDYDGVLIEPLSDFFRDTFGFSWDGTQVLSREDVDRARWTYCRNFARDAGLPVLCAVGLADGELCREEVGEILDFASLVCDREGYELTPAELLSFERYVRRTRPTDEVVRHNIEVVTRLGATAVNRLLTYCARVMEADGWRHHREVTLLNQISREMTGVGIAI
jgi:hypothetical protein